MYVGEAEQPSGQRGSEPCGGGGGKQGLAWGLASDGGPLTVSQELDQPTPRIGQVFIPGIFLRHPYTLEYAFNEFQELAPWWVLAPNWW